MLSSCVQHKELINFEGVEFPSTPEDIANDMTIRIKPDDVLYIKVHSYDQEAAEPFNLQQGVGNQGGMNMNNQNMQGMQIFQGYLVDEAGFIDMPVLGRIQVRDKSLAEAKSTIVDLLKTYINDPVVNIRFLNFRVTLLGEVNMPGTYNVPNNRVSVFDALGLANDLSIYANRGSVLVIREENGQRSYARLDLQSKDIFSSPYFYLEQNDVIYVEPLRARIATVADPAGRIISYSAGVLSLVTLIIALTN